MHTPNRQAHSHVFRRQARQPAVKLTRTRYRNCQQLPKLNKHEQYIR
jgi:hypothetical protein